jgi:hypothetical protein
MSVPEEGAQGAPRSSAITSHAAPALNPALVARTAMCPCGSARRYKHCCGLPADHAFVATGEARIAQAMLQRARFLHHVGESDRMIGQLAQLRSACFEDAAIAREAGELYLEVHWLQPAQALLERAIALGDRDPQTAKLLAECRHLSDRASIWGSANRTVSVLLDHLAARARERPPSDPHPIHIVCKLDTIGGTEQRALNLHRSLVAHAEVTLWSTVAVMPRYLDECAVRQIAPGAAPSGGTLLLVGTYFPCGDWLEDAGFERVVICHNLAEQHASLIARLRQLEANASRPRVDLVFPSRLFREVCGLPGFVEYSSVDLTAFRRTSTRATTGRHLVIGRHGRAIPLKFHPNDPSFFRALIARGHRVRILGGDIIAPAFAHEIGPVPELLAIGAETSREFLESLDVFVYRKHPELFETGGTVILEAMAMGLPVIMFPEQCGIAELIEHGRNGFFAYSEAEAHALIERLADEPSLRERVGNAARETMVQLMRRQESALSVYMNDPD